MEKIRTSNAPEPAGHYEQAIVFGGLVYVSGQLPIKPGQGPGKVGTIEEQTNQVLTNLRAILEAAGTSMSNVLKVTVYVSDVQLWAQVNEVYAEAFGDHRPTRVIVPTQRLHFGYQVEIDVVAAMEG